MRTGDLFGEAHARRTDPATSAEAAVKVSATATELEAKVLEWLKARGALGGTSAECAQETGLSRVTVSPRFAPLARKLKIKDSGERRDRSIVWVAI